MANVKKHVLHPMIHTYLHASLMADDFVPLPRCICAYVLCNMPVHHVVSTLNTLNTRQVRPTTGNSCTYETIAYSYRSVYSTVRALVWQNERETEEREGTTPSNVLKS